MTRALRIGSRVLASRKSMTMSESPQQAERVLSDGSRLQITWTRASEDADTAPLDLEALAEQLRAHAEAQRLPKPELSAAQRGLVGSSPSMQALTRMIAKVAPTQATVLITGENGTGKELVARAIHDGSPRASKPFVAANCSAFNDNLLESELFGHKRGAFTGAVSRQARGCSRRPTAAPSCSTRWATCRPRCRPSCCACCRRGPSCRWAARRPRRSTCASSPPPIATSAAMVKKGTFREDLYYRLHVVALRTPPLRERGGDLDVLLDHFLAKLAAKHGRDKRLSPEAHEALRLHSWPGNVRELQNETERIWVLSGEDPIIQLEHLSRPLVQHYLRHQQQRAEPAVPRSGRACSCDPRGRTVDPGAGTRGAPDHRARARARRW